jgi:hypoxanthine-DNA glycosylase
MKTESFNPISNSNCVAIILGTMPGLESLRQKKYYSHSDNLFWDITIRVLRPNLTDIEIARLDYEDRQKILLESRIALWDVLKYCDRKGSLDSAIRNEIKNDFVQFFEQHTKIQTVFFNGQRAKKYFESEFKDLGKGLELVQIVLPSTSPTHKLNCFEKLKQWRIINELVADKE